MTPKMLREKPIRKAIEVSARGYTAKVDPIIRDLSNSTQRALKQDLHTFAGFKAYHHLQEVAGRSRNADGTLKSWQEFVADTVKIDDKYNKTWLKAEYAFVQASAQMAAKWERFAEFGDAYDLLYKTAGDEKVRADHARLNGMCLPFSDPAWDTCFPPNGWGCRCDVIQVIPGTHPRSESKEVVDLMEEMTPGKQEIFRFNPGKEQKLIPPRHPYYGKTGNKESEAIKDNLHAQQPLTQAQKEYRKELQKRAIEEFKGTTVLNEVEVTITSTGIKEFLNQPHDQYFKKNELVRDLPSLIRNAKYLGTTPHKSNEQIVCNHIFECEIDNIASYLIAREEAGGKINFYSISDSDVILKGLKKETHDKHHLSELQSDSCIYQEPPLVPQR